MVRTIRRQIENVIADKNLPYTHLSDAPDGDVVVWYEDGTNADTITAIVQAIERSGLATYQGEEKCHSDNVTGLVFAPRGELPIDVEAAASAVIESCKESQECDDITVPITAVDEAEMPKRLGDGVAQSVWDRSRDSIVSEIESRGYTVE